MQLPHPLAQLAGCCWLARHVAKTRLYLRGEMPFAYRIALGSRVGVDGYFFRHFGLSKGKVLAAIRARPDDAAMADWFRQQPGVTLERTARWNRLLPLLGTRGHPGYFTRRIVTPFLYPKALRQPVDSLVASIVQDENLPSEP